jgi:hypothetical protein
MSREPRLSPRQSLKIEISLVINADKAGELPGDPGFLASDGEYGLPMSGIELRGDLLAWALARSALEELGESLDAYIVNARAYVGSPTPDDVYRY